MANNQAPIQLSLSFCASDGDMTRWPTINGTTCRHATQEQFDRFLRNTGNAMPGNFDVMDLPLGYALFYEQRQSDHSKWDPYLYGHPRRKFRSAVKFAVHAESLRTGNLLNCRCESC